MSLLFSVSVPVLVLILVSVLYQTQLNIHIELCDRREPVLFSQTVNTRLS